MIFQRGGKPPDVSQWQCLKKGSSLPPRSRIAAFKARFPHRTLKFKAIQLKIRFPSNLPLASVRSEASFTDEKIQAMLSEQFLGYFWPFAFGGAKHANIIS